MLLLLNCLDMKCQLTNHRVKKLWQKMQIKFQFNNQILKLKKKPYISSNMLALYGNENSFKDKVKIYN